MIINILEKIFDSNCYEKVNFDFSLIGAKYFIYTPVDKENKEEYFVLLELLNQSNENIKFTLEDISEYLFETIINYGNVERYFGKNSTLIICHKENKIERMTTLSLEEDLYNFKKNVIAYTEKELHGLIIYLKDKNIDELTNETLRNIINEKNGSHFIKFKENNENNTDYYSVLMKIFLKLPFLTYETQEKGLSKINEDIDKELSVVQRKIRDDILNIKDEWTEENILSFASKNWGK
ncbi:TPA: hypothetical protein PC598_000376 [Morganella morganii]|nr:hypothetical protein [Morganella morganii]